MAAKIPIERVGEIMKVVLTELKNAGGEAKLKDLFERYYRAANELFCAHRCRSDWAVSPDSKHDSIRAT